MVSALAIYIRRSVQHWRGSAPIEYSPLNGNNLQVTPSDSDLYVIITSLARLGLIMAYFFICDRLVLYKILSIAIEFPKLIFSGGIIYSDQYL